MFCTEHFCPSAGPVTVTLRFTGLVARAGTLAIVLTTLSEDHRRLRRRVLTRLPAAELAGDGASRTVRFTARPGATYQVMGLASPDLDAAAEGLAVRFDPWGAGSRPAARLREGRRRVFAGSSRVERRPWRRSPVEAMGLLRGRRATLAEPTSQMCTASQLVEPDALRWLAAAGEGPALHRKAWEIVYILRVLEMHDMIRPGTRGLTFGVGAEFTPALLAARGCEIVATDLPGDNGDARLWAATGQLSDGLARLRKPALCPDEVFDARVSFRPVDMNAIPADLTGFDFCWSTCAFEHLGSIEQGLRFFRESMRCLKPGGVAIHTTELNLSSNTATLDHALTVLFRRRDMERLALALVRDGHQVLPITWDGGDTPLDAHVDVPPFGDHVHLRVAINRFVTTSFGLVARRGGA